ncbi:hypothetical protein AJ79_01182 [Helicocarpus griseus UAMH5409]|uniref:glucan 1,4-alpha-glucosidase n=1 Tax=Helicocarpus griseus UAMH5409 TaxID=1447875 RepID=A0A2B7Y8P4_9EURO|nr:hypothetical protein AJ79_01182 [Helicocarpus griseus UAMH5409]
MHVKFVVAAEALFAGYALAVPTATQQTKRQTGVEEYIASESPIAYQGVLNNIGPDGSGAQGAAADFYTWTRDSGLVFKELGDAFIAGDAALEVHLQNYVTAQAELQKVSNPSGDLETGGLGEPKFHVDMTAFTEEWGRPQSDGPALRAIALITYANHLIGSGQTEQAQNIWPLVQNDIAYVTEWWNKTTFDLWEEVEGSSFFTAASQHRALIEANALAAALGQTCEGCEEQASQVLCFVQDFWTGSAVNSNINTQGNNRAGLDANSFVSIIHTFDPEAPCDDVTFQPCSARSLANHKAVVDSFREGYGVNQGIEQGVGVAVGRYIEDVYMGGNPWYLCTAAAAEILYDALFQWAKIGTLSITDVSLPFFTDIYESAAVGDYAADSEEYTAITAAVKEYADSFIGVLQKYTPKDGSLAEQFGRDDGTPKSAAHLTWSYASFLTMIARRGGIVPPTWGAATGNTLPDQCSGASGKGNYAGPATVSWPSA